MVPNGFDSLQPEQTSAHARCKSLPAVLERGERMKIFVLLAVIHYGLVVPISIFVMLKESRKSWRNIMHMDEEKNG